MAARRLLILMLLLLAVSTVAAALVPQSERDETTSDGRTAPTGTQPEREEPTPPGKLVRRTIEVAPQGADRIELRRGDQLALVVRSGVADQVAIPAFGQLEDLTPEEPARFNLLPDRTGAFKVRLLGARRVIGRIRVRSDAPPGASRRRGDQSRSTAETTRPPAE
jgi:hypothetical protein